jgi:hypothetical protein
MFQAVPVFIDEKEAGPVASVFPVSADEAEARPVASVFPETRVSAVKSEMAGKVSRQRNKFLESMLQTSSGSPFFSRMPVT